MTSLLTAISSLASTWIGNAQKRSEARVNEQIARGQVMASDWKDEFWSIILAIPLVHAYTQGGFEAIGATPDWYQIMVGLAVASSFGVKSYKGIKSFGGMSERPIK